MKIIKPSFQIIKESSVTKKIEKVARVCYKSEDKIAEGTDIKMVNALVKRQHTAMLEHASIALEIEKADYNYLTYIKEAMETYCALKSDVLIPERSYMRFTYNDALDNSIAYDKRYIVSGNIRAWYNFLSFARTHGYGIQEPVHIMLMEAAPTIFEEFNESTGIKPEHEFFFDGVVSGARLITDFSDLSAEERMVHEDVSVLFTVDRGITHELVRHRDASFAQESTRYCNYNLGKFGQEITVIEPCFWSKENEQEALMFNHWKFACQDAESMYFQLIKDGATPQQARDVLPTSVKAEIVVTANLREWKHIFALRACDSTGPAHPQIKEVMIPCLQEMREQYAFAFENLVPACN